MTLDKGTLSYVGGVPAGNTDRAFTVGAGGATLDAEGTGTWTLIQNRYGGVVNPSNAPFTLTGTGNGYISLTLSGTNGLTKTGAGSWTLAGSNIYSGPTVVSGGTLYLTNSQIYPNANWAARSITVNNGGVMVVKGWSDQDALNGVPGIGPVDFAAGNLTLDNGTLTYIGGTPTGGTDRTFTVGLGGAALDAEGTGTWTLIQNRYGGVDSPVGAPLTLTGAGNGYISLVLGGSGGVIKNGAGRWTLAGTNTYTGNTTVNAGTLEIVYPTLPTNSTVTIASSARLQLDFSGTNTVDNLVIGGVLQAAGVYSSTNLPAYLVGTGTLHVTRIPTAIFYDGNGLDVYQVDMIETLLGLVNRGGPRLLVDNTSFYADQYIQDYTWNSQWEGIYQTNYGMNFQPVSGLPNVLWCFRTKIAGFVAYDPNVDGSRCVAITMAGIYRSAGARPVPLLLHWAAAGV